MKQPVRRCLGAATLACLIAVGGCGKTPPISFSTTVATPAPEAIKLKKVKKSYELVTRAWTRHGLVTADYQQIIEVYATLRSPQWATASLRREFAFASPSLDTRDAKVAAVQKRSDEFVEVSLLVSTWDRAENTLHRLEKSPWTVTLVGDKGEIVAPIAIERDKRPDYVIRAEFPAHGDFSTAYKVRFPNNGLLSPDRASVTLRVYGVRGAIEMTWRNGERISKYY